MSILGAVPDLKFPARTCDTSMMRTWTPETAADLRNAMIVRRKRIGRALRVAGVLLVVAAFAVGGYVGWLL